MTSRLLKNYDTSEETVRKIYDSRLRLAILDALRGGPMRLSDLRRVVGSNAPNTSAKAKELEEAGFLERDDNAFKLTAIGEATLKEVSAHMGFFAALCEHKAYWLSRRLDFIPSSLWGGMGALRGSKIVKSPKLDTTFTHDQFVRSLMSAKESFRGISPIYHKDYVKSVGAMAAKNVDIELIFTPEVFEEVVRKLGEKATALMSYPKIKVFLCEGLDSGIAVGESFMNLCLVSKTDVVSLMDQYLYSESPEAVAWGNRLFDYYLAKSKPIRL